MRTVARPKIITQFTHDKSQSNIIKTPLSTPKKTPLSPKLKIHSAFTLKLKNSTFSANEILTDDVTNGSLWIGNYNDSLIAHEYGIHSIINLADECKTPLQKTNYISYYHYHLIDKSSFSISNYFDEITNLINELIKDGKKILIHCREGISRSPAFAIAYLMKYHDKSYNDAHDFIKNNRNKIALNFGFHDELQDFK
jgi:hypothetical protein